MNFEVIIEDEAPAALPPNRRRRHWEMLAVAAVVVLLALTLEVRGDQRVTFSLLPQYPLPEMCLSRAWFGVTCPGCGLTRSIIFLAHGDWHASWSMHRLGWLLAAAVLVQFPYRIFALRYGDPSPLWLAINRAFGWLLIYLLVGNWVLGLLR